jgi:hypothetical protein
VVLAVCVEPVVLSDEVVSDEGSKLLPSEEQAASKLTPEIRVRTVAKGFCMVVPYAHTCFCDWADAYRTHLISV